MLNLKEKFENVKGYVKEHKKEITIGAIGVGAIIVTAIKLLGKTNGVDEPIIKYNDNGDELIKIGDNYINQTGVERAIAEMNDEEIDNCLNGIEDLLRNLHGFTDEDIENLRNDEY